MSSTQRLQDYIDSLKAARLSSSTGGGGGLPPPSPENQNQNQNNSASSNSSPFHTEPRDYLELEFMDSLDQRMQQLEKNLATSSSSSGQTLDQQRRNHLQQQRQHQHHNSPPPNDFYPNHTPRLTLAQKLQQQQHSLNRSRQLDDHSSNTNFSRFQPNNTSNNASSLRSTFHSQFIPPTSLVFRVTLPFLRSTLTTTSNNNSECATFMVHVADLSQTGDDLLWHIIAQARIRFPDLMEVGGFEWTPGAASSLVLFALSADEANHWVETDQSKGGAARAGGAFLHYNAATPIHKYMPIARALRKREEGRARAGNMSGMLSTSISEAMTRNFQEVGPAVDVEIFVLLKSLVPQHELTTESLRKALV